MKALALTILEKNGLEFFSDFFAWVARRVTGLSFGTGLTPYKLLFFGEKMLRLLRKKSEKTQAHFSLIW